MDDASTDQPIQPAELWHDVAKAEERKGEYLSAYDYAKQGLASFPEDDQLQYLAVLALARSGAMAQAARELEDYGLTRRLETDAASLSPKLAEDIAALSARLAKDRALLLGGAERRAGAAEAAALYKAIYDRTGGYYPGINAATMSLLGGNVPQARALAEEVLAKCAERTGAEGIERYYVAATEAEAALLLDDRDGAEAALRRAAEHQGEDLAAVATTRKQLRLICAHKGIDPKILAPLDPPQVIHFVGHMIAAPGKDGRFPAELESEVADRIAAYLDEHGVGFAYGSLACGTDILFAEALQARGAEVHAFLPFDEAEFKRTSVEGGGPGWPERFEACRRAATSVAYATDDRYMDDDALFSYAAQLAMGTALLRAEHIDAEPVQVAVWDGRPAADAIAGTAVDVEFWRSKGLKTHVIALDARPVPVAVPPASRPVTQQSQGPRFERHVRAMLFGDIKGFSGLKDHAIPMFNARVMGTLAQVMDGYEDRVLYRNTWGDAIYVVLDTAGTAAACALDMQAALGALDRESAGLPDTLSLRLGGHFGPVFDGYDYVCKEPCFFGAHVTRAARLEPVTPVGEVYVTESFAAGLAVEQASDFACEYVGHLPSAKGFGEMRMYLLQDRRGTDG